LWTTADRRPVVDGVKALPRIGERCPRLGRVVWVPLNLLRTQVPRVDATAAFRTEEFDTRVLAAADEARHRVIFFRWCGPRSADVVRD
jgi:hypothetical protein